MTYRVILGQTPNSIFPYRIEGLPIEGRSHQPLLDACRQLKSMGADPAEQCALFHGEEQGWTLRTTVGVGAKLAVQDKPSGGGVIFVPYRERPIV